MVYQWKKSLIKRLDISMKMPISEIIDRYSITLLKFENTKNDELLKEIESYKSEMINYGNVDIFVQSLYDINKKIWKLESDIRMGKEEKLGLEEVGKRALQIRDLNKKRIALKNELVHKFGEGFEDIKIDHCSS